MTIFLKLRSNNPLYFSRKDRLLDHFKSFHENIRNFRCDICEKLFYRKDKYHDHVKVHSGIKGCVCNFCDKAFVHKKHLKRHISKVHDVSVIKYRCQICLIECTTIKSLRTHSKLALSFQRLIQKV